MVDCRSRRWATVVMISRFVVGLVSLARLITLLSVMVVGKFWPGHAPKEPLCPIFDSLDDLLYFVNHPLCSLNALLGYSLYSLGALLCLPLRSLERLASPMQLVHSEKGAGVVDEWWLNRWVERSSQAR